MTIQELRDLVERFRWPFVKEQPRDDPDYISNEEADAIINALNELKQLRREQK